VPTGEGARNLWIDPWGVNREIVKLSPSALEKELPRLAAKNFSRQKAQKRKG
jgi:hypothetical protein